MNERILRKHFGPLMLSHIVKDERIREYRGIDDTIDACRENTITASMLNYPVAEYYKYSTVTFRDYEN